MKRRPRQDDDQKMDDVQMEDEDDGLPKTCEANDILVNKEASDKNEQITLNLPREPDSGTFKLETNGQSSKSRSFAEP